MPSPGSIALVLVCASTDIVAQAPPERISSGVLIGNLLSSRQPLLDRPLYHSGCVTVAVQVDKKGTITEAVPVSGPEDLRQSVADAVREYRFKPILRDGVAIPVQSTISTCVNTSVPPPPGTPIRLSSGVAAAQLLHRVLPVYPESEKQHDISGAVTMHLLIDAAGNVAQATVISGPEALRERCLAAVRQWKYRPYLVKGVPVPVDTTFTMQISFGQ